MIAFFTGTALGRQIAALGALLIGVLAIVGALISRGGRIERDKATARTINAERATHKRIDHAPTLRDASDADRRDWLRKYARRNSN
jgi:hypothetical protein